MILEDQEKALVESDLIEFERIFKIPLPEDFKRFYLVNNGGFLPEGSDDNPFLLGGFTAIKYGDLPVEEVYASLINGLPELTGMIPFAYDVYGSCFLLSLREEDYGKVYIYLMDEHELAFVAECFGDFIDELQEFLSAKTAEN